jgi:hypothetical protein
MLPKFGSWRCLGMQYVPVPALYLGAYGRMIMMLTQVPPLSNQVILPPRILFVAAKGVP